MEWAGFLLSLWNQYDKLVEQGGSRSPPIKGRGGGGVCNILLLI